MVSVVANIRKLHACQETTVTIATDELLAALNELLEAERAGARVARETAGQMPAGALATLMSEIQRDEAHWCGVLLSAIRSLGATPSDRTGAFWGKAMAIADVGERLAFLNLGQAWVVRKLQALVPRLEHERIRADLEEMLRAHVENIRRVEGHLPGIARAGASRG